MKPRVRGDFQALAEFASKTWVAFRGLQPTTQRRILGGLGGLVALLAVVGVVAGMSSEGDGASAPGNAAASALPSTSSSASPTPTPMPSKSTVAATHEVLTAKNSQDLRKLLALGENCSAKVARFASEYRGRTISFDGSVAGVGPHNSYKTRFDFLLAPGNKGANSAIGPSFEYTNVNYYDLNLTGRHVPDSVGLNDKLRFTARVGHYKPDTCQFFLIPVSTRAR
ncbi:MAG: DUF4839 domain-containing protein [Mycobacteriaceae bacterium]